MSPPKACEHLQLARIGRPGAAGHMHQRACELPVAEPEVVSCAPEPVAAPTPSATAASVKKRRAPRKHNPDAHKRYLANLSQEKKKLVRLKKPRLPSALGLSGACGVEA
eukprot:scaffold1008_cov96-Isochrysis_galbana.AAC.3